MFAATALPVEDITQPMENGEHVIPVVLVGFVVMVTASRFVPVLREVRVVVVY
jgi:hypothetical protein